MNMFTDVNVISVVVVAILAVAVRSIWYSPLLFGSVWMESIGLRVTDAESTESALIRETVGSVIVQCIFFFIVALFVSRAQGVGLSLVALASVLTVLMAASTMSLMIWEKKTMNYVFISVGYSAIIIFGGVGILAYWPW